MRIDFDLVRELLLIGEAIPEDKYLNMSDRHEKIIYHLRILGQLDLVKLEIKRRRNFKIEYYYKGLTYKGHEFLSWIHDQKNWDLIKSRSKQIGIPLNFKTIPILLLLSKLPLKLDIPSSWSKGSDKME